jgi:hypothetical protein
MNDASCERCMVDVTLLHESQLIQGMVERDTGQWTTLPGLEPASGYCRISFFISLLFSSPTKVIICSRFRIGVGATMLIIPKYLQRLSSRTVADTPSSAFFFNIQVFQENNIYKHSSRTHTHINWLFRMNLFPKIVHMVSTVEIEAHISF